MYGRRGALPGAEDKGTVLRVSSEDSQRCFPDLFLATDCRANTRSTGRRGHNVQDVRKDRSGPGIRLTSSRESFVQVLSLGACILN
ncbi:hypothetical protein MPTK1_5g19910 [Marchantia polymorpha subsp. ruderalis]|uniref:Uncharacterized protein n=2 Tax=Marchantia polymorpha TaxID=3197 RepID=A0AAF6BK80_MARPO|nr:hypothetical protein MARPO_0206s0008 [Marchantia polymorpha]BBN12414.1 hypothetical protein Mp_5g19910 [Marchantia polymorpha subsp. ruderalis]|eukprot:PTQ27325.1 hypothetical protein MARPO_0206s0008 [Marchantia polymorpha]